jgi:hypothetical protein
MNVLEGLLRLGNAISADQCKNRENTMTPELAWNQAKPALDLLQLRRFGLG